MSMLGRLAIIFCLTGLSACDTTIKSTTLSTDAQSLEENAIVVARVSEPTKDRWLGKRDHVVLSYWRRLDGAPEHAQTRYIIGRDSLLAELHADTYHEHMIMPGVYQLEELHYKNPILGKPSSSHDVEESHTVTFEVKPGETIYIGDIKYNHKRGTVKVVDNYTKAKTWFKEHHPEITKPLEKRLVTKVEDKDPGFELKLAKDDETDILQTALENMSKQLKDQK